MTHILRITIATTMAGLFAAASLSAQTPSPTVPGPSKVVGCVERADQVMPATAGTTVDSLSFVLINPPQSTGGTPGTPSGSTERTVTFRLDGDVNALNPHVGHKVEVTGVVQPAAATDASDPASPANAPTLKVETITLVAETCTP